MITSPIFTTDKTAEMITPKIARDYIEKHDKYEMPRLATPLVWAVPRSLATTGGIIHLFSLPAGTKMFQFPALALLHW